MIDDDESLCLGTRRGAALHCTFLVFLEAMDDEIPVSGATNWPLLHYMTQCCQPGVETSGLAKKTTDLSIETRRIQ